MDLSTKIKNKKLYDIKINQLQCKLNVNTRFVFDSLENYLNKSGEKNWI